MRIPLLSTAALLLWGCGSVTPASIDAPDQYEIRDSSLTRIGARARDEAGQLLEGVEVYVGAVSDPTILQVGHNSELQCQKWGVATVTLEAPPARKDVLVACRLVKELRAAPQKLRMVVEADAGGTPIARPLGAFQFQAIGFDGKAIKDAPIEIAVSGGGVIEKQDDGTLMAVQPGRATITGLLVDQTAAVDVEVGLLVATRKGVRVEDGRHLGIPVVPGRYRVALGSDVEVQVRGKGGQCEEAPAGTALEVVCTFEQAGTVRVENPGALGIGKDAQVTLRLLQVP